MPDSYVLVCPYCGGAVVIGDRIVICVEPGSCTWSQEEV